MIGFLRDLALHHGLVGPALILLGLAAALLVVMALLAGVGQAGAALARGWRGDSSAVADDETGADR